MGRGSYLTRDDVEAIRPGYLSDMLVWTPGVAVRRAGETGDDRLLIARRVVDGRIVECPLRVLVDGELMNPRLAFGEVGPVAIDATVDQGVVDGVEIYVNAADVPPALGSVPAGCGAIAIWTRSGRPPRPATTRTTDPVRSRCLRGASVLCVESPFLGMRPERMPQDERPLRPPP